VLVFLQQPPQLSSLFPALLVLLSQHLDPLVVLSQLLLFNLFSNTGFLLLQLENSGLLSLNFALSPLFSLLLLPGELAKVPPSLQKLVLFQKPPAVCR
jgi:hypothetical protein